MMIKFILERTDSTSAAWATGSAATIGQGYREYFVQPTPAIPIYTSHDASGNHQLNIGGTITNLTTGAITGLEATDLDDNVNLKVVLVSGGVEQLIWEGQG